MKNERRARGEPKGQTSDKEKAKIKEDFTDILRCAGLLPLAVAVQWRIFYTDRER
jgi:hypothetical protein